MPYRKALLLYCLALTGAFAQNAPGIQSTYSNSTTAVGQAVSLGPGVWDDDGVIDISSVTITVGHCTVSYSGGYYWLANDAQDGVLMFVPGHPVSNSYCTLDSAGVSGGNVNGLFMYLSLRFTGANGGSWDISVYAVDYEGLDAWGSLGTLTIGPGPQPPTIVSTSLRPHALGGPVELTRTARPRASAGADVGVVTVGQPQVMTVSVFDPAGAQNIQAIQAGTNNCMPSYQNGFVWLNGVSGSIGLGSGAALTSPTAASPNPRSSPPATKLHWRCR